MYAALMLNGVRMAWNTGVNFGILSGGAETMRWVLIALALGISLWVWRWITRSPHGRWAQVSAGVTVQTLVWVTIGADVLVAATGLLLLLGSGQEYVVVVVV